MNKWQLQKAIYALNDAVHGGGGNARWGNWGGWRKGNWDAFKGKADRRLNTSNTCLLYTSPRPRD